MPRLSTMKPDKHWKALHTHLWDAGVFAFEHELHDEGARCDGVFVHKQKGRCLGWFEVKELVHDVQHHFRQGLVETQALFQYQNHCVLYNRWCECCLERPNSRCRLHKAQDTRDLHTRNREWNRADALISSPWKLRLYSYHVHRTSYHPVREELVQEKAFFEDWGSWILL